VLSGKLHYNAETMLYLEGRNTIIINYNKSYLWKSYKILKVNSLSFKNQIIFNTLSFNYNLFNLISYILSSKDILRGTFRRNCV